MVLRSFVIILLSSCLYSCGGENKSVPTGNTEESSKTVSGKTLYDQNCAACHGNDGKLGASGAKDLTSSQLSNEEITRIIREGKNGMPPMESLLGSEKNLNAVTDYVKSMRK